MSKYIIELDDKYYELAKNDEVPAFGFECRHIVLAVKNGTPYNPTGDAISRSDLVQAFKEECCGNCHLCERFAVFENGIHHCGLIDNAPTVPQINVFCENADEKAVEDMKAELQNVIESRPKGEWKLVERDNQDIDVVCPFCNSIRFPAYSHGYTLEELEEYLIRQHLPNFCEDCGADLQGKKK